MFKEETNELFNTDIEILLEEPSIEEENVNTLKIFNYRFLKLISNVMYIRRKLLRILIYQRKESNYVVYNALK